MTGDTPATPPAVPRWRVLLGDVPRVFDGPRAHAVTTRKSLALLLVLAIGGAAPRARLAALLWPDVEPDAGRRNLRREVHRWRQAGLPLQDLDGQRLAVAPGQLHIEAPGPGAPWVDVLRGLAGEDFEAWLDARAADAVVRPALGTAEPVAVPAMPVSTWLAVPPFVPRAAVDESIGRAWSRHQAVFLGGPPGVGKTRTALAAGARHGAVLHVAARPEDADEPFGAAVRALRALRDAAPDVALPGWVVETLASLMPEWQAAPGQAAGREQIVAAGVLALRLLAADNFNVLLFDDWQWVDEDSARLWMRLDDASLPIHDDAAPLPLRLVAFRAGELAPAVLAHVRAQCDAGRAVRLDVGAFSVDEFEALLAALLGAPAPALLQRLHAATGGHPLFALETLQGLVSSGRLRRGDDGHWHAAGAGLADGSIPLPPTVREAVVARAHALGPLAARVLQAASVAAPPLRSRGLAAVIGAPTTDVDGVLDHALAAGLLVEGDDGLRFAHDLVRESLQASMSLPRRQAWHRAWAMEGEAGGDAPARVAAHWDAAVEPVAARRWHLQAAESAARVHALPQAVAHWRAALRSDPPPAEAVTWQLACADALRQMDRTDEADAQLRDAAALAGSEPVLRRRVWLAQATLRARAGRLDEAEALVALLEREPDGALGHVVACVKAELAQRRGQLDVSLGLCLRAAETWPDEPAAIAGIAEALSGVARAAAQAGDFDTGAQACERGLALLRAVDAPVIASGLLSMLGVVQTWRGERDPARRTFVRAADEARRGGHPNARRMALLNLAKLHSDAGEITDCLAVLDELDGLPPAADAVRGELFVTQVRWFAHWLQGDLDRCREAMPHLLALADATADAYARLSTLQLVVDLPLLDGGLDEARALLDRALADPGLPQAGPIRTTVDNKQAWWLLRAGQPAAALAWLDAAAPADLDEARLLRAAVRAGALRVLGRLDEALAAVKAVAPDTEGSGDTLARWLTEWWLCTRASGLAPEAALVASTRALLAGSRAPALDRRALQAAAGPGPG